MWPIILGCAIVVVFVFVEYRRTKAIAEFDKKRTIIIFSCPNCKRSITSKNAVGNECVYCMSFPTNNMKPSCPEVRVAIIKED